MAHRISENCISCGKCAEICPVEAISEGEKHFEVDPELCIDCGVCESECEIGAIAEE